MLDILLIIVCAIIVLGVLVFIHEGGHYLSSRALGIRVTEFMIGLPGPSIGFTKGGTRFGVTAILLGGYARVCGMEPGKMSPYLKPVLAATYKRGTANLEEIAQDCNITDDEAYAALEELVEWGSVSAPTKKDLYNTYRAPEWKPSRKQIKAAKATKTFPPAPLALGQARPVQSAQVLYDSEYHQQYRSLPFWKRSIILLSGVAINLLFAVVAFVVLYSIIGFDTTSSETGELVHITVNPLASIQIGFAYIGAVVQAVVGLFNPATAGETISSSTSIIGIAVLSKEAATMGFASFLSLMAMISVSLGIMNLLPIPPLDGGRFIVEVFQKISRRVVSMRVLNYLSTAGMILFIGFFLIMVNQDIQRFVFGNWG